MRSWWSNMTGILRGVGVAGALLLPLPAHAVVITLGSGTDDTIGNTDSNLLAVEGPADADFSDANWLAAVATLTSGGGSNPFVITKNGAWLDPIAGTNYVNPQSNGASEGSTAAYMATFTLPAVNDIELDLSFLSDNLLNGFRINTTDFATSPGGFTTVTNVNDVDIESAVAVGLNRIFFRAVDTGGPAGFDFLATITYTEAQQEPGGPSVPEPATLVLFGTGLLGFAAMRRARRRD